MTFKSHQRQEKTTLRTVFFGDVRYLQFQDISAGTADVVNNQSNFICCDISCLISTRLVCVSQDILLTFHQEGDNLSWEIISDHELQHRMMVCFTTGKQKSPTPTTPITLEGPFSPE